MLWRTTSFLRCVQILNLCWFFQVLAVLNVIDPGYNRDRGVILRHLSEVNKILSRKMFGLDLITQDQFTRQVHECMILFEESQKCMSMIVKK